MRYTRSSFRPSSGLPTHLLTLTTNFSMPFSRALCFFASLTICLLAVASPLLAQPAALVTQPVDNSVRTVLPGNVHPLARAQYDQGEAPPNLALHRMLLVLKRSNQQEAVLRGLIDDQQDKHSASYHQWLTPEEFGAKFGAGDSDLAAVTNWLQASGFQVTEVSKGRTIVEFSGTAGLVKQYFGTAIHQYAVNGEQYWANASNPSIPTALTPVVHGFASLNNFPRRPHYGMGPFPRFDQLQNGPLFTFPFDGGTTYGVSPYDFATIYNVLPLWTNGIDGSGEIIAIVGETNINLSDIETFRSTFGLPANDPTITLNGPDPGILTDGEESEAVIDVSWSGAVAKGATINFVVSESTETSAGIDLSAIYIINQNFAPVMSESYGFCELGLGNSGNAFYSALWEQAAAQGITVLLSAGDGGSAGCDNFDSESEAQFGVAVSGYASTPFNVSVGGTDFNDLNNPTTYWNTTNNAQTGESAKSYIPETTWNDSCAGFGANECTPANSRFFNIVGGSGGPSNCAEQDINFNCIAGYAKPAWQTGTGVPPDGVRDQPDVSLFASNGFNGSAYVICEADLPNPPFQPCSLATPAADPFGGTSVSTPAFAGVMALVNQQTGSRQGNANYILYKLAAPNGNSCNSSTVTTGNSCLFYDITKGNNSVPCVAGSPNCGPAPAGGFGVLVDSSGNPAWTTNTGYDMATGLGSVNVNNLVTKWTTATFAASTTTLTNLSPVNMITHGATVNVTVTVAAKSGGGTPTGDVSLAGGPNGKNLGIDGFTLSNGVATGTTNLLPGGSYNVTARYEGDQTFGASESAGVAVKVSPENSQTSITLANFDSSGNLIGYSTTAAYGSPYILRVDVYSSSSPVGTFCSPNPLGESACPTGKVTITDNGATLDASPYTLNSEGSLEDQTVQLPGGSDVIKTTYAGDNSFNGNTTSQTISITPAATSISNVAVQPTAVTTGQQFTITATIATSSSGVAPTGTVTFLANGTALPAPVLTPVNGGPSNFAALNASLTTSLGTAGTYTIKATYSGDGNYVAVTTSNAATLTVSAPTPGYTLSAGAANPTSVSPGSSSNATVTATPANGYTGTVTLSCSISPVVAGVDAPTCSFSPNPVTVTSSGGSSTLTFNTVAASSDLQRPLSGTRDGVTIARSDPNPTAKPSRVKLQFFALWLPISGLTLVGFVFGFAATQRKKTRLMCLICLLSTALILLPSCGGGGSGGNTSCLAVPGVPTGLAASNTTSSGTTLTWTAPAGIPANCTLTGYTVYQNGTVIATTTNTTFAVTGLTAGTQYSFTVAANDSFGVSPQSSPVSVTTTGATGTPAGTYTISITGKDATGVTQTGAAATVTVTVN
jgi:hypothetical protein